MALHRNSNLSLAPRLFLPLMILTLWLVSSSAMAAPASSKAASSAPSNPSTTQLKTLVHTLRDKAAREHLITELNTLIAAQESAQSKPVAVNKTHGRGLQQQLTRWLDGLHARTATWAAQLRGFARVRQLYGEVAERLQNPRTRRLWAKEFAEMLAALLAAWVAGWLCRRLLRATANRFTVASRARLIRAVWVLGRILLDFVPIAVFVVVGYVVVGALHADYVATVVTLTIINALAISRGVQVLAEWLIAPESENLRLFKLSDETANYWLVWLRRFIIVGVYGFLAVSAAAAIGLPPGQARLLNNLIGLLIVSMLILLILQNRVAVATLVRSIPRDETPRVVKALFRRIADMWHLVAVIYIGAIYLVGLLRIPYGLEYLLRATLLSAVVIVCAKIISNVCERGLNRLFAISPELKRRLPGLEKRVNRYLPMLLLAMRCVIYAVAGLAVLQAWRLDIFGWLVTSAGQRVLGTAVSIVLAVAVAAALWEALTLAIEHYLAERTDVDGNHRAPSARALTVMPLLRAVLAITLGTLTALIVLSQLGINIAPLLAGAGILGLAVGFGSQTLVKDFITGLFILLQDTVSVGDVVEMAGSVGTVEALSIRSIRLRDLSGNVHVIPFSDVTKVTNMTKGFSYAVFDVGVAYREDMDEVMQVMKTLTEELREDSQWSGSILAEAEIFGVNAFGDSAITVRARLKTVAGAQWRVQREFNRRLKKRFDELDIEMPFPHQTIYFGVDKTGNAPPAHLAVEGLASGSKNAVESHDPPVSS